MNHAPTGLSATDKAFLLSLNLSDPKDCERYSKWLTERDRKQGIRTASAGELRCGITYVDQEDDMKVRTLSVRERIAHQIQGYGSVVDDTPDAYASVTDNRAPTQSDLTPDMDPDGYDPYGKPPNGYLLALVLRHLNSKEAK